MPVKQSSKETSATERAVLTASATIMGLIILYVWVRSEMLLWGYTVVHTFLTGAILVVLASGSRYKTLTHALTILGVIGTMSAIMGFVFLVSR